MFQPIIGLEIHIELKTRSKMFCGCSADYFGHGPNTHVCPICLGLPGSLPVANKKAIEWTIMAGLALNCKIPLNSCFDRKNYFYPDLPKGYQISQYDLPLAVNGSLNSIRIRRVHLEEDTAKMIHTKDATLLDFNRSGVPLMEVVTEPDISSPQEAKEFLKKLQQIIRFIGISDCDMEKGSMRIEPNISMRRKLDDQLPKYKVEIKNINSFRFMEKALEYEIKRQTKILATGRQPIQETRGWDEIKQISFSQRIKEETQDYRYFPEPDLPPIRWAKREIEKLKKQLPELPGEKMGRFQKEYGLSKYQVNILTETRQKAKYFEETVKIGKEHRLSSEEIANVIINKRVDTKKLLPAELVGILVKKKAIPKISGTELKKVVVQVMKENPKAVADYREGKTAVVEFLVGQVMKKTRGKGNPHQARKEILKFLKS